MCSKRPTDVSVSVHLNSVVPNLLTRTVVAERKSPGTTFTSPSAVRYSLSAFDHSVSVHKLLLVQIPLLAP